LEFLFEEASLFVYPSTHEGFGLPLLEAMARDVPVIASDIPALRETADAAARFVNAFDSEALGNEIVRLLADQELCADLVQAGRQRVAKHSWAETARRTRNAYQAAANGKT
jgi:glycosyltransferase involved in cell wall biosynthesis